MGGASGGSPIIVMTADAVGGVWTYALTLCASLPQYRFVLAVMGPPPSPEQREAAGALDNVVLEQRAYRLEWMAGAEADLAESRQWLRVLARRYGATLLHCNGYAHGKADAGCPVLAVAHSDVLSWWAAVHGEAAPASWDRYRREVLAGLSAAERVVAPTGAVLSDLSHQYGFTSPDAQVIPNGVDLTAFAPRSKRPVVMAAGRLWDMAKHLALLDDIAGELAWPVEIAGEATHPESGPVWLGSAHLLGHLGRVQMAEQLGAAAIFAAPARYEPFGLGILEAAASGCALVLGDIASLRESWDGAAIFVPCDDRGAWLGALRELIANRNHRQRLAMAAQQRAQRFGREAMARRYAALYRELAGHRARRKVA
jgi:glycogen(starch) synthase